MIKTLLEWTVFVERDRFKSVGTMFYEPSFHTRGRAYVEKAKKTWASYQIFKPYIYTWILDSRFILLSDSEEASNFKYIALNLDNFAVRIEVNTDWEDDYQYLFRLFIEDGKYKISVLQIYKSYENSEGVGVITLNRDKTVKIKCSNLGTTEFKFKIYKDYSDLEFESFKELTKDKEE